jgi:CPA1 family monovalent cation:H+ antiporter
MLDLFAACVVITALLAYLNHRFVGLPTTIGVMAAALVFTLGLVGLNALGVAHGLHEYEKSFLQSVRFSDVVLQGMLSLLLFASALHVDLSELKAYRWPVTALASVGTLLSTLAVGYGMWFTLPLTGLELPLL